MPDSQRPNFTIKEYLAGEKFELTLDLDSDPTAWYTAIFRGPEENETWARKTFETAACELRYPIGGTGQCVLTGTIPNGAEPGEYPLERITMRHRDANPKTAVDIDRGAFIYVLRVIKSRPHPTPKPPTLKGIS